MLPCPSQGLFFLLSLRCNGLSQGEVKNLENSAEDHPTRRARPRDRGLADAAFLHVAFNATKRAGAVEELCFRAAFTVWAVVAGKKQNGVALETEGNRRHQESAGIALVRDRLAPLVLSMRAKPRFSPDLVAAIRPWLHGGT